MKYPARKTYPHFSIWQDWFNKQYDVVYWQTREHFVIVQTNIRTREKAERALSDWQQREKEKSHERD
jgi:hypothetical protein